MNVIITRLYVWPDERLSLAESVQICKRLLVHVTWLRCNHCVIHPDIFFLNMLVSLIM